MWIGPVGLAETNSRLIFSPANASVAAVRRPGRHDRAATCALRAGLDRDVEEARTGDLDLGDPRLLSRSASSSARARGLVPAFFASWSATLVA